MSRILVTGGASGLGAALVDLLRADGHDVISYDIANGVDVVAPFQLGDLGTLDVLINCAGVNRINWLEQVTDDEWDLVMNTNVKGIFKMTQACLPMLRASKGTVVNIVSNAAHMPMRCSAAYNASKGAALILSKQLARELISDGITVFSVSPNKLRDTGMSNDIDRQVVATRGWSIEEAQRYQMAGLLTGQETDPVACAEFITFLLSTKQRHQALAGCDIPYGL